ncbi:hypothetical protein L484_004303 [Morus notabilis]|uniref:Uncharacterized protein n=1 Tax=Morus notabilis TaxID=981085 RepID=W9RUA9_9ROSA|nr:hypothetical protein L484_004303 [Morus notabilis]
MRAPRLTSGPFGLRQGVEALGSAGLKASRKFAGLKAHQKFVGTGWRLGLGNLKFWGRWILDSAAQKAGISREKYVDSRREFLRSYNFPMKDESVGKRSIKKWFKDNKPQNNIRSFILCGANHDVHD